MRLIHLTDPHLSHLDGVNITQLRGKRWSGFVSWHKNRRKKYLPEVLEQLCKAVRAENADQILVTGDLVQIGMTSEIQMAADWLRSLGPAEQVMLVPGNHDVYARGSQIDIERLWGEYLFPGKTADTNEREQPGIGKSQAGNLQAGNLQAGNLQAGNLQSQEPESGTIGSGASVSIAPPGQWPVVRKHGPLTLIGLSTANVSPVFMASGKLDEPQLRALPGLLQQARAAGQLLAILIHHPPLPGMTGYRKSLVNAAELQAIFAAEPPDMVFYGHLHCNRETIFNDARIYCTTAASSVADAAYRVIDIEESGGQFSLSMQLKAIDAEAKGSPGFISIDANSWTIPRRQI